MTRKLLTLTLTVSVTASECKPLLVQHIKPLFFVLCLLWSDMTYSP